MTKTPPVTVKIKDKILSKDRWIVFLIILGMITIIWTAHEIRQIDKKFEEKTRALEPVSTYLNTLKKENLSRNSGLVIIY